MTTVCLVGDPETDLRFELLSRETAREALATYDLRAPFDNSLALDTVSLGAAVSLCNDLNWYLVRFVDEVLIREPSVDPDEWLSRDLATAVRNDAVRREETDRFLKVYGLEAGRLVAPMYLARSDDAALPEYDLRDVEETVHVRVTREEFEG
ncbi:DUF5804 family protein [Halobaculum lipolyticum]|uniref:DUF5804 family protein n=1 Tax=Halobaculum lipolyticum TaxID=3032001 RepID=A0ABD5WG42_9EURY|nr:DUF5804 family protein [Halobaculum sp. DT31]